MRKGHSPNVTKFVNKNVDKLSTNCHQICQQILTNDFSNIELVVGDKLVTSPNYQLVDNWCSVQMSPITNEGPLLTNGAIFILTDNFMVTIVTINGDKFGLVVFK